MTAGLAAGVRRTIGAGAIIESLGTSEGRSVALVTHGHSQLVAKLLPRAQAAQLFTLQSKMWAASVGCELLRVPKPLAFDEDLGVVVMEAFDGAPMSKAERLSDPALARVGGALAELHALDVDLGPCLALDDHLQDLMRPNHREFAAAFPEHAEVIAEVVALCAAHRADGRMSVIHRDVHLRQLFDIDGAIGLVDWDLAACGDPTFDVGYLDSYLHSHYGAEVAAAASAVVIRGYSRRGGTIDPQDLAVYRCFNLLRRAARNHRLRDDGWRERFDAMFVELDRQFERAR